MIVAVALAQPTVLLAYGREAASFASLVNRVADPVDTRIAADRLVARVDKDDFEVLVYAILVNPI